MNAEVIDYALTCLAVGLVAWGLIRGLAGELASFAWITGLSVSGYFGYSWCGNLISRFVRKEGVSADAMAIFLTILLALAAALLIRALVKKCVSFVVPQPWNAVFGGLCGAGKTILIIAILAGVGFTRPGEFSNGYMAQHSKIVAAFASFMDARSGGGVE